MEEETDRRLRKKEMRALQARLGLAELKQKEDVITDTHTLPILYSR